MNLALPRGLVHTLEHNPHLVFHDTVEGYLSGHGIYDFDDSECRPADRAQCIASGELWILRWYPDTVIGHYTLIAPSFGRLMELAREHVE